MLAALLLAACGGAVQPAASDQQPAATFGIAGQAVVIEATLESLAKTQAVNQAEIADATSRAAVATAQWQGTQSALVVQATQDALRRANDAATATAVIAQDRATQAAGQTSTAQSFAALSMQQAITATGTAIAARAAAVSTEESAKAQSAIYQAEANKYIWEFIKWAVVIVVVLAGIVGLYFETMIWSDRREYNRQMLGQKLIEAGYHAEIERGKKEQALIVQVDGKSYYADRGGGLVPIAEFVSESVENKAHSSKWRAALKRLVYAGVQLAHDTGEKNPFTEKALASDDSPVVTHPGTDQPWSDGYRTLMDTLKRAGVMYAERGKAATWAKGWDFGRFEREFDLIPLPDLPEGPPPDVRITLRTYELSGGFRTSELPNPPEGVDDA